LGKQIRIPLNYRDRQKGLNRLRGWKGEIRGGEILVQNIIGSDRYSKPSGGEEARDEEFNEKLCAYSILTKNRLKGKVKFRGTDPIGTAYQTGITSQKRREVPGSSAIFEYAITVFREPLEERSLDQNPGILRGPSKGVNLQKSD